MWVNFVSAMNAGDHYAMRFCFFSVFRLGLSAGSAGPKKENLQQRSAGFLQAMFVCKACSR